MSVSQFWYGDIADSAEIEIPFDDNDDEYTYDHTNKKLCKFVEDTCNILNIVNDIDLTQFQANMRIFYAQLL